MKCIICKVNDVEDTKLCNECVSKIGTDDGYAKGDMLPQVAKIDPINCDEEQKKVIVTLKLEGRTYKSLTEQYGVNTYYIKKWVEKYRNNYDVQVTNSKRQVKRLDELSKKEAIESTILTEEYIMENHQDLITLPPGIYEEKSEFLERQERYPVIEIRVKDNAEIRYTWKKQEEFDFDNIIIGDHWISITPLQGCIEKGKIEYLYNKKLLLDKKLLNKYSMNYRHEDDNTIIWFKRPLELYRGKTIHIEATGKTYFTIGDAPRLLEQPGKNLDYVLKRNNLHFKNRRTKVFNKWLEEKGYI